VLSQNASWPRNVKGLAIQYREILLKNFIINHSEALLSASYMSSIFAEATSFSLTIKNIVLSNSLIPTEGFATLEVATHLRHFLASHGNEQDIVEDDKFTEAGNASGIFKELEIIKVAIGDVAVQPVSDDAFKFTRRDASAYEESVVLMSFVKELLDVIHIRRKAGCPLKTVTISSSAQGMTDLISMESDWILKLAAFSSQGSQ
jgi:hypothetical protein